MLEILTITPPLPRSIMCFAPSRAQRKTPVRFTPITAFHCSVVMPPTTAPSLTLTRSPSRTMPALLTRPSSRPKSSAMLAMAAVTSPSSATLTLYSRAFTDFARQASAVCLRSSVFMSMSARSAPRSASCRAIARPIPRPAPVTTTVLLRISMKSSLPLLGVGFGFAGRALGVRGCAEGAACGGLHLLPHLHVLAREIGERPERRLQRLGHLRLHGFLLPQHRGERLLQIAAEQCLHRTAVEADDHL